MRLRTGFTVNLLDSSVGVGNLSISAGSRPLRDAAHVANCTVAAGEWRPLTGDELAVVTAAEPRRLAASVSLLDLGPDVLAEAHETLLPLLADDGGSPSAATEDVLREFQATVSGVLDERYGIVPETTGAADLIVHGPGQPSTAFNPVLKAYMGLHIDSHQQLPFADRSGAMTLCAVNVGVADRYLNFVNLPVRELVEVLAGRGVPEPESASDLKDAFFAEFPQYPVLRLTIRPGQAYLCNTQNTIHDGATNDLGKPDISFLTLHRLADAVPSGDRVAA